jgi:hypothetical protein
MCVRHDGADGEMKDEKPSESGKQLKIQQILCREKVRLRDI